MRQHRSLLLLFALAAAALLPVRAGATTVDTYSFTQAGWQNVSMVPTGATLSGTFTGTVEATGFIEQSDLTAFSATLSIPPPPITVLITQNLSQLTLFSFDTNGGASALDFAGLGGAGGGTNTICVGAAATLDPTCSGGVIVAPAGTRGVVLQTFFLLQDTPNAPVVTLVSSVTTTPAVPEPGDLTLLASGLAGLIFVKARFRCPCRTASP